MGKAIIFTATIYYHLGMADTSHKHGDFGDYDIEFYQRNGACW